jgi:t-SNARE complex subunit (syntaxin)
MVEANGYSPSMVESKMEDTGAVAQRSTREAKTKCTHFIMIIIIIISFVTPTTLK